MKCPCGKQGRYMYEDKMSCNKYSICPSYNELSIRNRQLQSELDGLSLFKSELNGLANDIKSFLKENKEDNNK